MKLLSLLLGAGLLYGVAAHKPAEPHIQPPKDKAAIAVAKALAGAYHNRAQAKADSAFFEIHLHMKPIWGNRTDGQWLYVEQAISTALQRPYRQRIYRVYSGTDGQVISEVYTLNSPLRFAGAWEKPSMLDKLTPDSLMLRQGCAVVMTKADNGWKGGTVGQGCESDLRGAKYATSEVTLTDIQLVSWDRGYNAEGKQVWGATKGGYIFDKVEQLKP